MPLSTIIALLLTVFATLPTAAQEGSATPAADTPMADVSPQEIADALAGIAPPENLPGNTDSGIVLESWEEHYGEALDLTLGAWVMTGSSQLPMASVIVFETSEGAAAGVGDFRDEHSVTSAGELDAWVIADRGKWVCMAADGPVLIIGQAEPEVGEAETIVRERSCEVTAEVHAWAVESVDAKANNATPEED